MLHTDQSDLFSKRALCPHKNCSKHRNDCGCCPHNRVKRCIHNKCIRTCMPKLGCCAIPTASTQTNSSTRKRNLSTGHQDDTPPVKKQRIKYFTSFPVTTYGTQEDLQLNSKQWREFQILLLLQFENMTNAEIKNELHLSHLSGSNPSRQKNQIENLRDQFSKQLISFNDFLLKKKNNLKLAISPLKKLNSQKTLVRKSIHHSALDFGENDILEPNDVSKLLKLFENLLKNKQISQNDFNYVSLALKGLKSIRSFLAHVKSKFGKTKEAQNLKYTSVGALLFKGCEDLKLDDISKILNVTKYFLQETHKLIDAFKEGEQSNLSRNFNSHELYSTQTSFLAVAFWKEHTETHPGGRSVFCRRKLKNGKQEVKQARVLPCGVTEFYEMFILAHGPSCTDWRGNPKIPSESWFKKKRPWYVKKGNAKQMTGYCTICLIFENYLRAFEIFIKKNCSCDSPNCQNFTHHEDCQTGFLMTDDFCNCFCDCDDCLSCCKSTLNSFRKFCGNITCSGKQFGEHYIPDKKCFTNECQDCLISGIDDICALCPSSFQDINLDSITIKYKILEKQEMTNSRNKKFYVPVFVYTTTTIRTFLNKFLDLIIGKNPFPFHYYKKVWQRLSYNKIKNDIKSGNSKLSLHHVDNGESYKIQEKKCSADQFYSYKQVGLSNIVSSNNVSNFEKCSTFYICDPNVNKGAAFTLDQLNSLLKNKKRLPKNKSGAIVIASDGSCKEYLTVNLIQGLSKLSKTSHLNIFWIFFGEYHGKGVNDQQFARLKTKLRKDVNSGVVTFSNHADVYDYCVENLIPSKWSTGGDLTDREFVKIDNHNSNLPKRYSLKNTKKYRTYAIIGGKLKRKSLTCFCPEHFQGKDCNHQNITGLWEDVALPSIKKSKPAPADTTSSSSEESSSSADHSSSDDDSSFSDDENYF